MESIRILIVDDHQMMIDGLKKCIDPIHGLAVTGELSNGISVIEHLGQNPTDVVLLDISMPGKDGLGVAAEIKSNFPAVKVVMLTMHDDIKRISEAIQLGVDGYILKNTGVEELEKAIKQVYRGKKYFSDDVSAKVIMEMSSMNIQKNVPAQKKVKLTRREQQVIKLILDERTTSEIAEQLNISVSTVETHRKNLMKKANARNTAGLVQWAIKLNI